MSDTYGSQGAGMAGTGRHHSIAAMFRTRDQAQRAVEALVEEGFSRDEIRMVEGSSSSTGYSDTSSSADEGFWASLRDLFFPDEDRHVYAEGLRRGGYLVSVRTTTENYEQAADILDDEGTLDLDESEASWPSQGWSGYTGSDYDRSASLNTGTGVGMASTGGATAATDYEGSDVTGLHSSPGSTAGASLGSTTRTADSMAGGMGSSATGTSATTGYTGSRDRDLGTDEREEVIPIAEERLRVGKRVQEGGRVRVRTYVVEEPVSEQVNLRQEHVSIERRPVDRALTGEADPFKERTLELDEKTEQAVVDKEARVREELLVRKDVDTRNETVSDTVRRTEVDVQDDRGNTVRGTGTSGEPRR